MAELGSVVVGFHESRRAKTRSMPCCSAFAASTFVDDACVFSTGGRRKEVVSDERMSAIRMLGATSGLMEKTSPPPPWADEWLKSAS